MYHTRQVADETCEISRLGNSWHLKMAKETGSLERVSGGNAQDNVNHAKWEYHLRDVLLVKMNQLWYPPCAESSASNSPGEDKASAWWLGSWRHFWKVLLRKSWTSNSHGWEWLPQTLIYWKEGHLKNESHLLLSKVAFNLGQLGLRDIWHCLYTFWVLISDVEFRRGKVGKANILEKPDVAILHRKHPTFCYCNMMV